MKKCNKCRQEKPFDSFNRDKTKKDGHHTFCNSCRKISSALYHQKNREEISRKSKIYYQLNKEQISEKGKLYNQRPEVQQRNKVKRGQYYETNKEKIKAQRKIYRDNNKELIAAKKKLYSQRPEVQKRRAAQSKTHEAKQRRKELYQKNILKHKARNKKYREDNKEILKQKRKERNQRPEVQERSRQWHKEYNQRPDVKERTHARQKKYAQRPEVKERKRLHRQRPDVKKRLAKYYRDKRKNDIQYRLRNSISRSVRRVIIDNRGTKKSTTWSKLPYTPQQLKEHLEAQFEPWMNWDNHGDWHIDHIYPQSKLPYDSMDHPNFLKSWSLENLRPLKATENLSKSNKIIEGKKNVK